MKKKIKLLYILLFMAMIALPALGMPFYKEHEVTENKEPASFPELTQQGKPNIRFASELGDYLSDHFAGRQELVTTNALLRGKVFHTSSEPIVTVGKGSWLFYQASLNDYVGNTDATNREMHNLTRTLELVQEYCQDRNMQFLFTVAPNKATLYPQYLPSNYVRKNEGDNLTRLEGQLQQMEVPYVSLKTLFQEQQEVLYHSTDSHWNNRGAAFAQNALLGAVGKDHTDFTGLPTGISSRFEGDLDKILYPLARHQEAEYEYSAYMDYAYSTAADSTDSPFVETENVQKQGTLYMFRDSFGNSLLPFMAEEYGNAYFSRLTPYNVADAASRGADTVILEVVERNLLQLIKDAPVMQAPFRSLDQVAAARGQSGAQAQISDYKGYQKVTGKIDETDTDPDSPIYVYLTSDKANYLMEAFPAGYDQTQARLEDYGFQLYFMPQILENGDYTLRVMTKKGSQYVISDALTGFEINNQ